MIDSPSNTNQLKSNSFPVKATLLITSTLTVMSGATIAPSLPAMQEFFANVENSALLVRLVLTIPALFIAFGGLFAGQLVDKMGRKPLLIISTLLYGLAGGSGFILNSLGTILIGRAVLGLSVAGVMTSVTTLIADYYQGQKRADFMGLQAAFMGLGGVIFLSVGGLIADLNWRFPFLIYLSAWAILLGIVATLYEPNLNTNNQSEDSSKTTEPSMPIAVLVMIYGISLFYMVAFYLIPVQLPFYLQNLDNSTASAAGLAIASSTLASSISSLRYGFVKERLGFVSIVVLALAIAAVGYLVISIAPSYNTVLLGLIIAGLGFGLLMPNLSVWLSSIIPDALRGRALGGLTTFFFLGQFLSPIVSQPITNSLGLARTYGFTGVALFIVAIVFFTLRTKIKSFCQSC
ncbi:MAG: MFS transporter [Xenococcaceae cyanobacterium MO_188.B29]|nr:MFS transporter [Xenococcaceae cyanobacterium MO_188.B29]